MRLITEDALAIVTIWQEARGEPYEGKLAVGEVIRNRMKRNYFSNGTVSGTVLRDYQFSGWNVGDPNRISSIQIDDNDATVGACISSWKESISSSVAKGAVLYCNLHLAHPSWAKPEKMVAEIGNHSFFTT